jgi:RimJ/RimL family protein N-acetyltransferase
VLWLLYLKKERKIETLSKSKNEKGLRYFECLNIPGLGIMDFLILTSIYFPTKPNISKMLIQLETARTYLRNLTVADAEDFYSLNLDPEVMRYTGDNPFKSFEEAKRFLAEYDQYQKYGVGRLAVIEKKTGDFLGWCVLKYTPREDYYDLGYRFFRSNWNKGYATETALANLHFGFRQKGLNEIVGRAFFDNTASIKVLKKIGMTYRKALDFEGKEGVWYSMTKGEYENSYNSQYGFQFNRNSK